LLVHEGLNSSTVGGVSHEVGELLSHGLFGELIDNIKLVPEGLFVGFSGSVRVEFNLAKLDGVHHTEGGLEARVGGDVLDLSSACHDVERVRRVSSHANKLVEGVEIFLRDKASILSSVNSLSHCVVTIMLPDTSEMRFVNSNGIKFVRELHVLHLDDLRSEFSKGLVLSAESGSSFFGSGIHSEDNLGLLVGVSERVENLVGLVSRVGVFEHVTTMSVPSRLRLLVEEKSGGESLSELLVSEPLERVRFLTTFSCELHRSPFGVEVVHSVVPGSSGVGIIFPAVVLLSGGPVGDFETLEESTGLSVESDVTDTLKHGVGVEILGVQMVHDIRFLVEFVAVYVLNAEASISGFLDMETIGDKEEIRMNQFDGLRSELFNPVAGVEHELDPALISSVSNVVLNGSTDHTFAKKTAHDDLV